MKYISRIKLPEVNKLTLPALLAMHAAVWTIAAWLSTNNLDMNGDMVENYVWGIEWQAGYSKHPPLFAWVTALWFSVFPHKDWIYYGLSATNAAAGLFGIAALSRRFVSRDAARLATLSLAISPFYTTLAMKFNANAILLSIWPWAAYFFVAFMQGGKARHAIACGVFIGLAVLGKYFSAVLILALLMTALVRPLWRQRIFSLGFVLAVLAALLVLSPHIMWMVDHQFSTLTYASQRSAGTLADAIARYIRFAFAQFFYLLPSFGLLILFVRRGQRRIAAGQMAQSIRRPSMNPDLWWLTFAPLIAVGIIAVVASAPMASSWGMSQWFALGAFWLALLKQKNIDLTPARAPRIMGFYWALVLIVAAVIGWDGTRRGSEASTAPYAELAEAAQSFWHERTGKSLTLVGGSLREASSIVFYSRDATHLWDFTDPVSTLHQDGGLIVCAEADADCREKAQKLTQSPPVATRVNKRAWGHELPARTYALYAVVPRKS